MPSQRAIWRALCASPRECEIELRHESGLVQQLSEPLLLPIAGGPVESDVERLLALGWAIDHADVDFFDAEGNEHSEPLMAADERPGPLVPDEQLDTADSSMLRRFVLCENRVYTAPRT